MWKHARRLLAVNHTLAVGVGNWLPWSAKKGWWHGWMDGKATWMDVSARLLVGYIPIYCWRKSQFVWGYISIYIYYISHYIHIHYWVYQAISPILREGKSPFVGIPLNISDISQSIGWWYPHLFPMSWYDHIKKPHWTPWNPPFPVIKCGKGTSPINLGF